MGERVDAYGLCDRVNWLWLIEFKFWVKYILASISPLFLNIVFCYSIQFNNNNMHDSRVLNFFVFQLSSNWPFRVQGQGMHTHNKHIIILITIAFNLYPRVCEYNT